MRKAKMKAKVKIEAKNAIREEMSLINMTLDTENLDSFDAVRYLYGFINAVLKNEAVMNVFHLNAINREFEVGPVISTKNDCDIDITIRRSSGVQTELRPTNSRDVQLHLQVKFD